MLQNLLNKLQNARRALLDVNAWILILPALVVMALISWAPVMTMVQFMLFLAVLLGFCIQLTRIALPQFTLWELVEKAKETSVGAAILAGALLYFLSEMVQVAALWTKPL